MLVIDNSLKELKGKYIHNDVKILEEPRLVNGKWIALANAYGTLVFIELSLKQAEV